MKKQAVTPLTYVLVAALLVSVYWLWIRPLQSSPKVEVVFEKSAPAAPAAQKALKK